MAGPGDEVEGLGDRLEGLHDKLVGSYVRLVNEALLGRCSPCTFVHTSPEIGASQKLFRRVWPKHTGIACICASLTFPCSLGFEGTIASLSDCTPNMFIAILEEMVGCEIPGIKSDAVTVRDHEINMLSVLEFLGGSILGTDLGYIRVGDVCGGDETSIANLIDIFVNLHHILRAGGLAADEDESPADRWAADDESLSDDDEVHVKHDGDGKDGGDDGGDDDDDDLDDDFEDQERRLSHRPLGRWAFTPPRGVPKGEVAGRHTAHRAAERASREPWGGGLVVPIEQYNDPVEYLDRALSLDGPRGASPPNRRGEAPPHPIDEGAQAWKPTFGWPPSAFPGDPARRDAGGSTKTAAPVSPGRLPGYMRPTACAIEGAHVRNNITAWAFSRTQVTGVVVKLQGRGGVPLPGHASLCFPRSFPSQAAAGVSRPATAPAGGFRGEVRRGKRESHAARERKEELGRDSESRRLEREHRELMDHRSRMLRRLKAESEGMRSREAWLASEKARLIRLERDEADAVERLAREQAHAAKDLVSARAKQARARQRSAELALKRIEAEADALQHERHVMVRRGAPLLKRGMTS